MLKIKVISILLVTIFTANILFVIPTAATNSEVYPTGLLPPTEEELQWIEENMVHTVSAKLNSLGLARVNEVREEQGLEEIDDGLAVEFGDEAISKENLGRSSSRSSQQQNVLEVLPEFVDNITDSRTMNYFPPIVNQIGESCAAYSSTYYMMTYMTAFARGYNTRTDSSKIFSPRFTYNLCNRGRNVAVGITTGFSIALKHGCPSIVDFPLSGSNQHTAWPTTETVWRNALNSKMKESGIGFIGDPSMETPVNDNQDANLQSIKTYLANGYVLTFGTYFRSWKWKNQHGTNTPVCIAVDGIDGRHAMTIVGYDDNIWVDINDDGEVDSGELGAFKIVNSHGSTWNGEGWAWFAYDALNEISSVPGAPTYTNRGQGWWGNAFYWITAYESYSPILTAKFTINTNQRNEVAIELGQSTTTTTTPVYTWTPYAFRYDGGAFSVDGTTNASNATIVLDYTDIINKVNLTSAGITRWYFLHNNSSATISNISLKDETNNTTYALPNSYTSGNYTYRWGGINLPSVVNKSKQWNLSFNWPLISNTITNQNIYVRDIYNSNVAVSIGLGSNEKTVNINAPQIGYIPGKRYTINITQNVKTKGGNNLLNPVIFDFIVK